MEELLDAVYAAVLDGDIPGAPATVQAALDGGLDAETILREGMIAAMTKVGELYQNLAKEAFKPVEAAVAKVQAAAK